MNTTPKILLAVVASSMLSFGCSTPRHTGHCEYKTVILTYCILNVNAAFIRTVIAPFYPSFFPGPVSLLITLVLNVTITSYLSNPMLNKLFQDWIHSYTMKDIPKSTIGRILHLGIPGL
jgi:antibiotic biosynthesis monooxygenase (ABM) superfamily enzyme